LRIFLINSNKCQIILKITQDPVPDPDPKLSEKSDTSFRIQNTCLHPIYTDMQYRYAVKFTPRTYRQQAARYSPHTYRQ
jgi:hypothetical protein